MENMDGTIDELLEDESVTQKQWASILFQVCFNLAVAQKELDFTHNDLHTNNIMYTKTEYEFIYFIVDHIVYKVPTFGRIIKIIDFGRSILTHNEKL